MNIHDTYIRGNGMMNELILYYLIHNMIVYSTKKLRLLWGMVDKFIIDQQVDTRQRGYDTNAMPPLCRMNRIPHSISFFRIA